MFSSMFSGHGSPPKYYTDAYGNSNGQQELSGLSQFLSGLGGMAGKNPYSEGGSTFKNWIQQGINAQNPFFQAGTGALGGFQSRLGQMSDPTKFINSIMGQYQESPWAKMATQQAQNAGTNAAAASGMLGSTPYMQSSENTANAISNQDMQNWMNSVLGVNNQYMNGENSLIHGGENSADWMSRMDSGAARDMGNISYNQSQYRNHGLGNMMGGLIGMFL